MKILFYLLTIITFISSNSFAKVNAVRVMFNHNGSNQATIGWNQLSGDDVVVYYGTSDFKVSKYKSYPNKTKPTVIKHNPYSINFGKGITRNKSNNG
jgi:hypothetical protein